LVTDLVELLDILNHGDALFWLVYFERKGKIQKLLQRKNIYRKEQNDQILKQRRRNFKMAP
jgi:hypothetical protein